MTRLPQPGQDDGTWGNILNEYLSQAHNADGSLKPVSSSGIIDGSVTDAKIANGISADKLADGTNNVVFSVTDRTKLSGIATGATINDTDANLRNRANHTGSQAISSVSGLQSALDSKTALSVNGSAVATYNLDTTPISPADLSPAAYSRTETDAAIAAAARPLWQPVIVAPGSTTNYTTTTYTYVSGLQHNLSVGGTAEKFDVTATLDVAGYADGNSTMVVVLEIASATGNGTSYPLRFTTNGTRMPLKFDWIVSGMSAGNNLMRIAAYLTANGNYQVGTGSVLKILRIA